MIEQELAAKLTTKAFVFLIICSNILVYLWATNAGLTWSSGNQDRTVVTEMKIEQNIHVGVPESTPQNSAAVPGEDLPERTYPVAAEKKSRLIVVGLLSADFNYGLRMAQRETWLKRVPFLEYRFLLDNPTAELLEEQSLHRDMVFLNATFTGAKSGLGEKLFNWYRYAVGMFPEIPLIAKADDDVYVCGEKMHQLLHRINHPRLYAGWSHSAKEWKKDGGIVTEMKRVDEMFVIVGRAVALDIVKRTYCHPSRDTDCSRTENAFDTDFGGTSLGLWLSNFGDVKATALNNEFLHYNNRAFYNAYDIHKHDVCGEYALYHKASAEKMFYLHVKYGNGTSGTATSGKIFTANKIRSFDFSKVGLILEGDALKMGNGETDVEVKRPCTTYAVVTTIFKSTQAVSDILKNPDWCLVVVTDLKSLPKDKYGIPDNDRYIFLSVDEQTRLFPEFSAATPWNHFGRKNVGYLFAIRAGAKYIWDFDDDNLGIIDLPEILSNRFVKPCENISLVNPYMYFGVNETISWPRGFPLNKIQDETTWKFPTCDSDIDEEKIGVIQSLANNEPDVDGIYRLTRKTPFNFIPAAKDPLIMPLGAFTPFNGQATMWCKSAFLFLFLPTTVHGRVSDIWRSYIAEHFFGEIGLRLIFTKPYVTQDRNPHEFLGDFESEHDLYLKAPGLLDFLTGYNAKKSETSLALNVLQLFIELYERNIIGEEDILLFAMWLKYIDFS